MAGSGIGSACPAGLAGPTFEEWRTAQPEISSAA